MSTEVINIAGRYNKYLRNLSQSPWIDKNDLRVMDSVQELLEDGFKRYLQFDKSVFASSGREDVDVRMLGRGRPFVFKLHNPENTTDYNEGSLRLIQKYINEEHAGKISVRDLQFVDKSVVSKYLKEGQESKRKEYRALCCCSRKLTSDDFKKINEMPELCLNQITPIRVLHRRTWAVRQRTIYKLKLETVKPGEFESVKPENIENVFALTLLAEAGTYIKEFVHGDFGRTEPNMSILLGDCDTDLMELDVMVSIWETFVIVAYAMSGESLLSARDQLEPAVRVFLAARSATFTSLRSHSFPRRLCNPVCKQYNFRRFMLTGRQPLTIRRSTKSSWPRVWLIKRTRWTAGTRL